MASACAEVPGDSAPCDTVSQFNPPVRSWRVPAWFHRPAASCAQQMTGTPSVLKIMPVVGS